MEATLPEILDKISILKIKLEHAEADVKINLFSELDECIKSLRLFEDKYLVNIHSKLRLK